MSGWKRDREWRAGHIQAEAVIVVVVIEVSERKRHNFSARVIRRPGESPIGVALAAYRLGLEAVRGGGLTALRADLRGTPRRESGPGRAGPVIPEEPPNVVTAALRDLISQ